MSPVTLDPLVGWWLVKGRNLPDINRLKRTVPEEHPNLVKENLHFIHLAASAARKVMRECPEFWGKMFAEGMMFFAMTGW